MNHCHFLPICSSVTPEQWVSFTNENIINSEKERDASSSLRGAINGVLDQTQQDILKQRNVVNLAFAKRIHETKEAKQQLEQHLDKVNYKIVIQISHADRWSGDVNFKWGEGGREGGKGGHSR